MEVLIRPAAEPASIALFPGSFHPVTRAHMALAEAALATVDAVVFLMPRAFPHKSYHGVPLERRIELVRNSAAGQPRFGVAISEGGLFVEMAREARREWPDAEIWLLCGRDAAERIAGWRYDAEPIEEQLREFGLLTASRQGEFAPPPALAHRVRPLAMPSGWDDVSATEVRERIARRSPWHELVPEAIISKVAVYYGDEG